MANIPQNTLNTRHIVDDAREDLCEIDFWAFFH